jgi:hypothetical protein
MIGIEEIRKSVETAYGSLADPNYGFVAKVESRSPYRDLMEKLGLKIEFTETTDINDDVAFCYSGVSRCGEGVDIRLSMVGRYGYVCGEDGKPLIGSEEPWLKEIFEILEQEQVDVLSQAILEEGIPLALWTGEEANVFNALFSSVECLPWEVDRDDLRSTL